MSGIWDGDKLHHSQHATEIQLFIEARFEAAKSSEPPRIGPGFDSYVLNIDASWGAGKTFFMSRFAEQLRSDGHLAVYVDAWREDDVEDPIISVYSAINSEIEPLLTSDRKIQKSYVALKRAFGRVSLSILKGAAGRAISFFVGEGIEASSEEIAEKIREFDKQLIEGTLSGAASDASKELQKDGIFEIESFLDKNTSKYVAELESKRKMEEIFRSCLTAVVSAYSEKADKEGRLLWILVDELDRCRPTFAIEMLERIKHFFETPGVVFVIATDTRQLQYSVKSVYGEGFDGRGYLGRFFNRTYRLSADYDLDEFIVEKMISFGVDLERFTFFGDNNINVPVSRLFSAFSVQLRDIEKAIDMASVFADLWPHENKIEISFLFAMIIGRDRNANLYNFLNGIEKFDHTEIHRDGFNFGSMNFQGIGGRRVDSANLFGVFEEINRIIMMDHDDFNEELESRTAAMPNETQIAFQASRDSDLTADDYRLAPFAGGSAFEKYSAVLESVGRFERNSELTKGLQTTPTT